MTKWEFFKNDAHKTWLNLRKGLFFPLFFVSMLAGFILSLLVIDEAMLFYNNPDLSRTAVILKIILLAIFTGALLWASLRVKPYWIPFWKTDPDEERAAEERRKKYYEERELREPLSMSRKLSIGMLNALWLAVAVLALIAQGHIIWEFLAVFKDQDIVLFGGYLTVPYSSSNGKFMILVLAISIRAISMMLGALLKASMRYIQTKPR